jgi:hypothetical protein
MSGFTTVTVTVCRLTILILVLSDLQFIVGQGGFVPTPMGPVPLPIPLPTPQPDADWSKGPVFGGWSDPRTTQQVNRDIARKDPVAREWVNDLEKVRSRELDRDFCPKRFDYEKAVESSCGEFLRDKGISKFNTNMFQHVSKTNRRLLEKACKCKPNEWAKYYCQLQKYKLMNRKRSFWRCANILRELVARWWINFCLNYPNFDQPQFRNGAHAAREKQLLSKAGTIRCFFT